jgi:hypothetical protein
MALGQLKLKMKANFVMCYAAWMALAVAHLSGVTIPHTFQEHRMKFLVSGRLCQQGTNNEISHFVIVLIGRVYKYHKYILNFLDDNDNKTKPRICIGVPALC